MHSTFAKSTDQKPHSYLFESSTKHGSKPIENFELYDIVCIFFSTELPFNERLYIDHTDHRLKL